MKDIETRLAALEAENAALRLLLSPTKPAVPPRDLQVRITTPPLAKASLPTDEEFNRLLHVVLDRYPVLKLREDPEDYAAQFRAAFIRLQHCGRSGKIDNQRGLAFWLDDGVEWCRRHHVNPAWIGGAPFTAAVIAQGDIEYIIDDWPHDTAFSLQWGGGGRDPARDRWRRVLGGALLEPTPPSYPTTAPSPARVQQFAVGWRK